MQIMGKEFRTIENGLDPEEVAEFLKTAVGSSEESFRRLEQFSALQAATRAMDESIAQARKLAGEAKKQAEEEARQESERTLDEAREQAREMVDQAKNSCAILIDDVHTVLTDAISRAFEMAKETVSINLEDLDNAIHRVGVSHHDQIKINRQQSDEEPSVSPADSEESAVSESPVSEDVVSVEPEEAPEEEPEEEPDSDLIDLERSLAELENSLTSLHTSAGIGEDVPELQLEDESGQEYESSDEPPQAKEDDSKSDQYIGEVLVAIPGGADDAWMQELRQRTLKLPGTRIKAESGMDDNTTVITMSLDEPTALRSVLQGMPNVEKVVESQTDIDGTDKGPMKLLSKISKKLKHPTVIVELDRSSDVPVLL